MLRYPALTTEGETVFIVEKVIQSGAEPRDTQVLVSADGRKFLPVAGMKVEEITVLGDLPETEPVTEDDFAEAEPVDESWSDPEPEAEEAQEGAEA